MKRALFILWAVVPLFAFAQQNRISGFVTSHKTGEKIAFASILDTISGAGSVSNSDGYYQLSIKSKNAHLLCKYMGYQSFSSSIILHNDTVLNISLPELNVLTKEVTILARQPIHEQTLMGMTSLPVSAIEQIPSFLGEPDVLKAITLLPGISGGRDGYSNIMVRGGDRGQNLLLLDGAKLYNTNHLGGFVSVFNTDAIQQIDVYKGGFPARFGGRLSSVIDIATRDGNRKQFSGKYSIGLISSSLLLEGPIGKSISYIASARSSYLDLALLPYMLSVRDERVYQYILYRFYDINVKVTFYQSEKSKWSMGFFNGADYYRASTFDKRIRNHIYETSYRMTQNNNLLSLKNNLVIQPKLFLKSNITLSKYASGFNEWDEERYTLNTYSERDFSSNIFEINGQSIMDYFLNDLHTLKGGISLSRYLFKPGVKQITKINDSAGYTNEWSEGFSEAINTTELSAFIEDDIQLFKHTKINIGLRALAYLCDSVNYPRLEPRISLRSLLTPQLSVKANYTLMNQFNHVLINNVTGVEREIWLASSSTIPPQTASQWSLGLFADIPQYGLDFSVEAYYKTMKNLLEFSYPAGTEISLTNLESMVHKNGQGEMYGCEFETRFEGKKISTNLNYVLSWSYRQFETLNNGKKYPFLYDRRHSINWYNYFKLGQKYSLASNFLFSTGTPITLPDGFVKTDYNSNQYYIYSSINNRRLPDYHRLDLALTRTSLTRKGNEQKWTLNIFNAYARQNPVFMYYNGGKVYQVSMFSILPSISYSVRF